MQLIHYFAWPYARMVRVVAFELGLADAIDLVPVGLSLGRYNGDVGATNPIGKVPVLITDDGEALYDSYVICEYLDAQYKGAGILPSAGPSRWRVLRLRSLSDEIIVAGQLIRQESLVRPPAHVSDQWVEMQRSRIDHGLDTVESAADELTEPLNLGQIALACAVDWLRFRGLAEPLSARRNRLFTWFDAFALRPSMMATQPHDIG
jgi:glutathione S-transferase